MRALEYFHDLGVTHSGINSSQIVFDRRGKVRLSPAFGHILKMKSETQSSLDLHANLVSIMCKGLKNYQSKSQYLKDKFTVLFNQSGGPSLDKAANANNQYYANSIRELKKNDLFDLGVVLTLCCLLYTSPSPRDRQKSRMPSSA